MVASARLLSAENLSLNSTFRAGSARCAVMMDASACRRSRSSGRTERRVGADSDPEPDFFAPCSCGSAEIWCLSRLDPSVDPAAFFSAPPRRDSRPSDSLSSLESTSASAAVMSSDLVFLAARKLGTPAAAALRFPRRIFSLCDSSSVFPARNACTSSLNERMESFPGILIFGAGLHGRSSVYRRSMSHVCARLLSQWCARNFVDDPCDDACNRSGATASVGACSLASKSWLEPNLA